MLLNCLEQMSSVYDNMDSILITNRDGIVEYAALVDRDGNSVNNEGYTGKHLLDIYKDLTEEESTIFRVMKTGEPIVDEVQTLVDFNGRKETFCCCTYPITFGDTIIGAVEGVIYLKDDGGPANRRIHKRQNTETGKKELYRIDDFVTKSPDMIKVKDKVLRVAAGDSPIMIFGETGTGKEIIAQSVHTHSGRNGAFVSQNCSAIPSSLLESTLFGTVKGSYTGAENRKGIMELANGGTLFLDELNSMDMGLQGKILKAVEEHKIRRIGDEKEREIDVRIVSALNRDPVQAMKQGEIREDLYYRLGVVQIRLTPLRDRKNDIDLLINHFIEEYNDAGRKHIKGCSELAQNFLMEHDWPGNVRELRNAIEYAFNVARGEHLTVKDLPDHIVNSDREDEMICVSGLDDRSPMKALKMGTLTEAVERYEKNIIRYACDNSANASDAAEMLGISRQALRYKMKKYDLL